MHKQARICCSSLSSGMMLLIAILVLTGCGQSDIEATPNTMALVSTPAGTAIGIVQGVETRTPTRTPMPTLTPSMTPTATYTPMPTLPAELPLPLPTEPPRKAGEPTSIRDVVVTNGSFMFHVQRGSFRNIIRGWTPESGKKYFVLDGLLYNFGIVNQAFFDTDFVLQLSDGQLITADVSASGAYSDELESLTPVTDVIDFPGRNFDRAPGRFLEIPAGGFRRIVIVYQIPEEIEDVILQFIANGLPYQAIQIALVRDPATPDQLIMITTHRGDASQSSFAFHIVDSEIGDPIPISEPSTSNIIEDDCVEVDTTTTFTTDFWFEYSETLIIDQGYQNNVDIGLVANPDADNSQVSNVFSLVADQLDRIGLGLEAQNWYRENYQREEQSGVKIGNSTPEIVRANHRAVTTILRQSVITPYRIQVLVDNQLFEYQYAVEGSKYTTDRHQEPCTP